MVELAAYIAAILLVGLAIFQFMLAIGKPWGKYAWGGQHDGVLPKNLRIGSGITIIVYGFIISVLFDVAGIRDCLLSAEAIDVVKWIILGYFVLGIAMNGLSRSSAERNLMTPIVTLLAILSWIIIAG